MKHATVLSIGDELLLGQTADTNARWLSDRAAELGLLTIERRTVGDDRAMIARAIRELAAVSDLLLVTGGLGPTLDDLTRLALTDVVDPGREPMEDEGALRAMHAWFTSRGRQMSGGNRLQALRPPSAVMLENPFGTAPGLRADVGSCRVICMPGPPREMQPMFECVVPPLLPGALSLPTRIVRCAGLGESEIAERLGILMRRDAQVLVGTTASGGIVSVRLRAARLEADAEAACAGIAAEVARILSPYVFAEHDASLPEAIGRLLEGTHSKLVTCESCTGGGIAAALTDVAGSSRWFSGGWITYDNTAKIRDVEVPETLIEQYGSVSRKVAAAMAQGALRRAKATHALAVTGIAGPSGGSETKPVGTVYIAASDQERTRVRRFLFPGDRASVRERTVLAALMMLRLEFLTDGGAGQRLLWEQEA